MRFLQTLRTISIVIALIGIAAHILLGLSYMAPEGSEPFLEALSLTPGYGLHPVLCSLAIVIMLLAIQLLNYVYKDIVTTQKEN